MSNRSPRSDAQIDPDSLAGLLRSSRIAVNLTQDEVAEKIGRSQPTISSFETGEARPLPEVLIRLARLYGLDPGELVLRAYPIADEATAQ